MGGKSARSEKHGNSSKEESRGANKAGIFRQLFSPGSAATSGSESNDDTAGSAESETRVSTLSGSMSGSVDSSDDDDAGRKSRRSRKASNSAYKFDRDLRARHRGACKNMTVRHAICVDCVLISFQESYYLGTIYIYIYIPVVRI